MSELYIPQNIKIGYQKRTDALTGLLAYLIPEDEKGKYNQMLSWQRWRNHELGEAVIDNKPRNGYIINVSKTHVPFSSFGQERTKVRVHSADGYEFEISVENLIEILEVSDISKKYINAECVFAWQNKQIWLVPTNTKVYEKYQKVQQAKLENSQAKKTGGKKSSQELIEDKKRKEIAKKIKTGDIVELCYNSQKYMYVGKAKTYLKSKVVRVKLEDIDVKSKTLKIDPVTVPLLINVEKKSKKDILNGQALSHDAYSYNYLFSLTDRYMGVKSYVEENMSEKDSERLKEVYLDAMDEYGKKPLKYVVERRESYYSRHAENEMGYVWKSFVKKMVVGGVSKVEKAFFAKNELYMLRIEAQKYIPATVKNVEKFAIAMELVEVSTMNVLKRVECEIDEHSFATKMGYVLAPAKGWKDDYQMYASTWDENSKGSPKKNLVEIKTIWYS